jgi:hypothetical protein
MEALSSSETSVLTRATQRNFLEDGLLHSHRSENLKSYVCFLFFETAPKKSSAFVFGIEHDISVKYVTDMMTRYVLTLCVTVRDPVLGFVS